MNSDAQSMNKLSLDDEFETEIHEAQSTLLSAAGDLASPLGDLVRAQIKRSQPPICAAVVLAVAKPQQSALADLQTEDEQRRKRILLAAALEMLHVALHVHRLLVNAALNEQGSEVTLDRSFIGSTILAGDYCFSRAAQMAAQTEHPRVVATFAQALQSVSEGLLREQFQPHAQEDIEKDIDVDIDAYAAKSTMREARNSETYDDTRQLLHSGAHAAALLVDLPKGEQQQAIALSQELASHWALHKSGTVGEEQLFLSHTPEVLPLGWQALHRWLDHQRANGDLRATPPAQRN
jgi:geranylgeranyl pyrophosphate synthase